MKSVDELFSNLEVSGQPYAAAMQNADIVAGVLLVIAFLAAGNRVFAASVPEWVALLTFAVAGALGGYFPQPCPDSISAQCRALVYHFQLPASQYLHDGLGIIEFVAISVAVVLAARRTRGARTSAAWVYRSLVRAGLVAYPLLGLSYLAEELAGVMEVGFFLGFSLIVLTEIHERTHALDGRPRAIRRDEDAGANRRAAAP